MSAILCLRRLCICFTTKTRIILQRASRASWFKVLLIIKCPSSHPEPVCYENENGTFVFSPPGSTRSQLARLLNAFYVAGHRCDPDLGWCRLWATPCYWCSDTHQNCKDEVKRKTANALGIKGVKSKNGFMVSWGWWGSEENHSHIQWRCAWGVDRCIKGHKS